MTWEEELQAFQDFKDIVEDCSCYVDELSRTTFDLYHGPGWDEPCKLGDNPNLEALREAEEHITQAKAAFERFKASCPQ